MRWDNTEIEEKKYNKIKPKHAPAIDPKVPGIFVKFPKPKTVHIFFMIIGNILDFFFLFYSSNAIT